MCERGNMTKDLTLKPCPFCGNKDIQLVQIGDNGWRIGCKPCNIWCREKVKRFSLEWLKQRMIDFWNYRSEY
jgi:transcription elongation factor Elf1